MRSDQQIRDDVLSELKWDPSVRDDEIAVAVKDGVVTLGGTVDSYATRSSAIVAAERVAGVRAVADDMNILIPGADRRSDADIAHAALSSLKWHAQVPSDRIKLRVESGIVTIEGEVKWDFQRRAAYNAIRNLTGVHGVRNMVTLAPTASPADIENRIKQALHRQAELEAANINVDVSDGAVSLRGRVHSAWGRREAEQAVWNAPGVKHVDDMLQVQTVP